MLDVMPLGTGKVTTAQVIERLRGAGHQIDRRTIERDLKKLESLDVLKADNTRPIGWSRHPNSAHVKVGRMSDAEALSFHLVEKFSEGLLPGGVKKDLQPYFRTAAQKLATSTDYAPVRKWTKKIRSIYPVQPLLTPPVNPAVREAVTSALMDERKLEIIYRLQGPSKRHVVSPLGLIQHGAVFYVPVRFENHENVRTLALHRIRSATVLRDAFSTKDFNLDEWIESGALGFGELGKVIKIRVRFFDHAGDHLLESRLSADQSVQDENDALVITATVQDTKRLRWWLLAFGSTAEVLSPSNLRRQIAEEVAGASSRYQR